MDPLTAALALANVVPALMRYFGAGEKSTAVAQKVVDIAQSITGKATPDEAVQAIEADPKLAQEFRLAVLKADTDLENAYLADRQNARARDIALHQAGYHNRRADLMVAMDVVGLIACLIVLATMHGSLTEGSITLITTLAGYFGLSLRDAHQFEFGSSRGSREKDVILGGGAK